MKSVFRRALFHAFTLIELAIVLVIVSLMTGFGMKALQNNNGSSNNTSCYDQARLQMRSISTAMDAYVRSNGVYPRPASVTAGVTSNVFGAQDGATGTNISEDSGHNVWFGALPFSTLGLPAGYAADCWGNKYMYIVSQELSSNTSSFQSGAGHITIKTGTLASSSNISIIGAYAVISRGENALVPCQRNFTGSKSACFCNTQEANVGVTRIDKENCDTNNVSIFSTAFNNGTDAHDYFDDIVIYKEKAATTVSDCVPADVTWSTNCSGPVGALASGSSTTVTNSVTGYSGSTTVTCTAGVLSTSGSTCSVNSTDCSLPWGGTTATGTSVTAYLSATPTGACSSQSRTCTTGTLSGTYTNQACTAGCAAGAQTWLTNCTATASAAAAGGTQTLTNTAATFSGTATATCNAGGSGMFALSSTSCSGTSCTLPWGGTTATGTSVTAYLTSSPTGACTSQTRTCTTGTLSGSYTAQTCTAGCAAAAQTWSTNCTATTVAAAAGGTQTLTNTAANYGGSATATCNAGGSGAIVLSGTSCTATCALPWGGTINVGDSVTAYLSNTPTGTCTSETRTCSVPASCTSQVVSWTQAGNNCGGTSTGTVADGASQMITDDYGNGVCTTTCSNGTFAACSSKSCTATGGTGTSSGKGSGASSGQL